MASGLPPGLSYGPRGEISGTYTIKDPNWEWQRLQMIVDTAAAITGMRQEKRLKKLQKADEEAMFWVRQLGDEKSAITPQQALAGLDATNLEKIDPQRYAMYKAAISGLEPAYLNKATKMGIEGHGVAAEAQLMALMDEEYTREVATPWAPVSHQEAVENALRRMSPDQLAAIGGPKLKQRIEAAGGRMPEAPLGLRDLPLADRAEAAMEAGMVPDQLLPSVKKIVGEREQANELNQRYKELQMRRLEILNQQAEQRLSAPPTSPKDEKFPTSVHAIDSEGYLMLEMLVDGNAFYSSGKLSQKEVEALAEKGQPKIKFAGAKDAVGELADSAYVLVKQGDKLIASLKKAGYNPREIRELIKKRIDQILTQANRLGLDYFDADPREKPEGGRTREETMRILGGGS